MKYKSGQYFTKNIMLKQKIFEFILNEPLNILEPSIGRGDLVSFIKDRITDVSFDMYEIDEEIELLQDIDKEQVIYGDFLSQEISKTYRTIIGNPPYIKKRNGNIYIDFVERCYNLLDDKGELIFIVPSDFLKATKASKLLDGMINNGNFTHIFHPNDEKLFENASIDVILFRYCKDNTIEKKVLYNEKLLHVCNSDGLITFSENIVMDTILFKDYFDVYVGMVSGKEEVFKNERFGNIDVINGCDKIEKYIYIETFPTLDKKINKYMLENKDKLINRSIRKFSDSNWFEWGAPRNISNIRNNLDQECIYIYNLTRKVIVSFVGKINYFGGGLIMLRPKSRCNLENIVSYINSDVFKENFMFSGRFKIGHRQISNSHLPIEIL